MSCPDCERLLNAYRTTNREVGRSVAEFCKDPRRANAGVEMQCELVRMREARIAFVEHILAEWATPDRRLNESRNRTITGRSRPGKEKRNPLVASETPPGAVPREVR